MQAFDLAGHPTATRAYAWSHATEGERRRFVAVLHATPAANPVTAVRADGVAEYRQRQN